MLLALTEDGQSKKISGLQLLDYLQPQQNVSSYAKEHSKQDRSQLISFFRQSTESKAIINKTSQCNETACLECEMCPLPTKNGSLSELQG